MSNSVSADAAGVRVVELVTRADGTMDEETVARLKLDLDAAEAASVRAVVLVGARPGFFIRHYTLDVLLARGEAISKQGLAFNSARPAPERPFHELLRRIEQMPLAVIAAINGTAMGGGFELALACDLRVAQAGDFLIGLPEVNLGILPGAGGTQRLARLIGEARALELVMLGRTLSPEQALSAGLVHEVVADARARALQLAGAVAVRPSYSIAAIKRLVRSATSRPLADGLNEERTLFADALGRAETLRRMREAVTGTRKIEDEPGAV
jgi:enoyl-CoA hydratase/carnithine racemase